jgi:hypothetical protein
MQRHNDGRTRHPTSHSAVPNLRQPGRWVSALCAVCLFGIALLLPACSDTPTGLDDDCEVIYIVSSSDASATTGLAIVNQLSTGLEAVVEGDRIVGAGADMSPGACEVWGLFSGSYDVRLRPCRQDVLGSTECTTYLAAEVRRRLVVSAGERTELRVTPSFFP